MKWGKKTPLLVLSFFVIGVGTLLWQKQAVLDWWHLRNYTPSAALVSLANDDTMTGKARHLLYVNHPQITDSNVFSDNCPAGGEKTVVLGCYVGNDDGIYIYAVSDSRLNGVEQVTAAHEMLHAAYRRLSNKERTTIDAELLDYYNHDLTDQRIKDTIAAYRQSEPNDVVNEMHSVFGTEVANLPPALTKYYSQYFTNRTVITNYTASYQAEFTNRQSQVSTDDAQLSALKLQIDANQALLTAQKAALDDQNSQLQTEQNEGEDDIYNAGTIGYNQAVNAYNTLLETARAQINQYNTIVDQRNAVALEEQQLSQELSDSSLTK